MPNLSFFLPLILQSAVIPFGVALTVLAGLRAARLHAIAPAFALAAGFLSTYFSALHAQWSFLPTVALDWMPWIAVAGVAGALAAERMKHTSARLFVRLVLSTVIGAMVVWPALTALGALKAAIFVIAAGVVLSSVWSGLARVADRGTTPPLLLAVVAGGAGIALMLDSSQSIGQLSGALASVLGALFVFNLPRERMAFTPAAAGVAVLLLGALLLNAHVYAGFPLNYVVLLAGGLIADPLIAALNRLRKRRGGAGSWATAAVLTAVPVAATIALAVKAAADSGGY